MFSVLLQIVVCFLFQGSQNKQVKSVIQCFSSTAQKVKEYIMKTHWITEDFKLQTVGVSRNVENTLLLLGQKICRTFP